MVKVREKKVSKDVRVRRGKKELLGRRGPRELEAVQKMENEPKGKRLGVGGGRKTKWELNVFVEETRGRQEVWRKRGWKGGKVSFFTKY